MIRRFAGWLLRLRGWSVIGEAPKIQRYVIIAAPHTSNWDFPITLLAGINLGLRINWLGKNTLFRFPFGGIMRALGGIPVDRSKSNNLVESMVKTFREQPRFMPIIPPEATRSNVKRWKTGFYHIAHQAGVPIVCGFLDYKRKIGGLGIIVIPTGNIDADIEIIRTFYSGITGCRPEKATPITIH